MEAVTHHGRTTAYRVAARDGAGGAPVLCVHGSGGTSGLWAGQRPLSAERPVIAVDLSGHGESEDVAADPGYETLSAHVDDVVAVARATDARVLVGNSLGGAVALTLALERTHAFEGLVLTGTGARLSVLDDLLVWLDGEFERAVEFLHGPDRLFHDADERVLERSRAAMRETGPAVTRRDFRTCHTFDVRGRLDAVDVPAVAVVGEHDRLTPRRHHEYLARELPTCELAVVEDAAHLAMLESPTAFNAVLSEFCARFAD
jgi:pimeloyl-ACP methyl ester carboxylesterase